MEIGVRAVALLLVLAFFFFSFNISCTLEDHWKIHYERTAELQGKMLNTFLF